jgi:RNA methyltransferase, TrmH family
VLSSAKNPKVAKAMRLHKRAFRDEDRRFLVEGAQGIREALSDEPPRLEVLYTTDPLDELAVAAAQIGVAVEHVSEDVLRRLTSTVTPQPIAGIAPFVDVDLATLPAEGCWTILHEVRDPGNAGTVLRSADAAGAGGVVFTASSVDLYNPKTVRASAGSVFHLPAVRGVETVDAIAAAKSRGLRVLAMDASGADSLYATDLAGPIAFVFGNEAHGLGEETLTLADARVRVPHAGRAESLNLAAAATVCLFEWARRRDDGGHALETLIAAAAHDIRSPLTAMKGFGYALEKRWTTMTDDQRALMLSGIVHDADRMDQIVRLLVDAARTSAGGLELFPETVRVADVVHSAEEVVGRDPEHPGFAWLGEDVEAFVDPARLKTTILSFAESLVWWGSGGPIELRAVRDGERLVLSATRPTDEPLDDDAVEALFLPRRPGMGQGSKIGLYVARAVARAQGGDAGGSIHDGRLTFFVDVPATSAL